MIPRLHPDAVRVIDEPLVAKTFLEHARRLENGRRDRVLTEHDILVFQEAVRQHPDSRVVVYAGRGAYVPQNYGPAKMTIIEYWPAKDGQPPGMAVTEGDARRPKGRGPWVEVDGKKEV